MLKAVTLSERTSSLGALPSQVDNQARSPKRIDKDSATCCAEDVPKTMPMASSSTLLKGVANHETKTSTTTKKPPAPHYEAPKHMDTLGPRP